MNAEEGEEDKSNKLRQKSLFEVTDEFYNMKESVRKIVEEIESENNMI